LWNDKIMQLRYAAPSDAPAMARLFATSHHDALTDSQRAQQGFVQGSFDAETLAAMAEAGSLLVADDHGRAAGFLALSPPTHMPTPPPPVIALLESQDSLLWQGRPLSSVRWLLYGPVLVNPDYRGQGVARTLFDMAMRETSGRAELMVAFIESSNHVSWKVHVEGFGMTPLGQFVANGRTYGVVAAPAGDK
jgi:GNAT superfamily N-acetyltransferase